MSLLSAILLPELEKQLMPLEPQIAEFLLNQVHVFANDMISYVEQKRAVKTASEEKP